MKCSAVFVFEVNSLNMLYAVFLFPVNAMIVKSTARTMRMMIENSIAPCVPVSVPDDVKIAPPAVTRYGQIVIPAFCIHVAIDTAIPAEVCETAPPAPFRMHGIQIEKASPHMNAAM